MSFPFRIIVFLKGRNESDVSVEIVGCFVVVAMSYAPGVEGHEDEGVDDEAESVVYPLLGGEGPVATFVGEFPEARKDEALCEGVGGPCEEPGCGGGEMVDLRCEGEEERHV